MTNNQTPYSRTRNNITLIAFGLLFLALAMAFNSCTTTHYGCRNTAGYVGYGPR